jgi:hypothetical protein
LYQVSEKHVVLAFNCSPVKTSYKTENLEKMDQVEDRRYIETVTDIGLMGNMKIILLATVKFEKVRIFFHDSPELL